jgi:hypothetical protein
MNLPAVTIALIVICVALFSALAGVTIGLLSKRSNPDTAGRYSDFLRGGRFSRRPSSRLLPVQRKGGAWIWAC